MSFSGNKIAGLYDLEQTIGIIYILASDFFYEDNKYIFVYY